MEDNYKIARGLSVYLDGVRVCGAFAFNIAEGWVDCCCQSPSGYSNLDTSVDDFLSSRLYGVVEVSKADKNTSVGDVKFRAVADDGSHSGEFDRETDAMAWASFCDLAYGIKSMKISEVK